MKTIDEVKNARKMTTGCTSSEYDARLTNRIADLQSKHQEGENNLTLEEK